jgi:hypothetical protein
MAAMLLVAGRCSSGLYAADGSRPGISSRAGADGWRQPSGQAYGQGADVRAFYQRLIERIQQLPGVTAAGASTDLPLSVRERRAFTIEAESEVTRDLPHTVAQDWVMGQYFETLTIPLKQGRYLSSQDQASSEPVVVINETMARRFWNGQDAVGQRLAWGGPADHGPWMRIVGVVADVKQGPLSSETIRRPTRRCSRSATACSRKTSSGIPRRQAHAASGARAHGARERGQAQIRALDPSLPVTALRR